MGRQLQKRGWWRTASGLLTLTGAITVSIAACSAEAAAPSTAPPTTAPSTTTTPPPTTNTTTPPSHLDLLEGLPRSANYAFVETTVTAATISNVVPRTFLSEIPEPGDDPYLFLTLTIANRSQRDGAIINPTPFTLLVDGEPQPAPVAIHGRSNLGLGPLAETEAVLAFAIPEDVGFEAMVLAIAETNRIPTYLPLTGDLDELGFPVSLDVSGVGPAQGGASGCNQSLDITVFGGTAAIDLLESENYPTGYGSRRANIGERFLSLEVQVLNNGGSRCGAGGTNYSPDSFTLLVDGAPTKPVTFLSGIIAAGTAVDLTVDFIYPVNAATVEFAVGSEDGTLFMVPIDVSAVPPAAGESD